MRVSAILLLATLLPAAAQAAQQVTVDQIQQILTASPGQSDAKLAAQISSLEPVERIDTSTLVRWQAAAPGDDTRKALLLLADCSAFLPLPSSRIVDQPPPATASLQQTLGRTITYLVGVLHNLPNFMAERDVTQFEDSSVRQEGDALAPDAKQNVHFLDSVQLVVDKPWFLPLYVTAQKKTQVRYVDGHELQVNLSKNDVDAGLRSQGEFGSTLAVVVGDAFRQKLDWDHWVQSANGTLATFLYTVPAEASHYIVEYPSDQGIKRFHSPYHGEITIDPATGTVYRLTLIADMQPPYQRIQSALVLEYGAVLLGDRTYICPLRSVNLAREPPPGRSLDVAPVLRTFLNDVAFTKYHLFRGDARILGSAQPVGGQAAPQPH